MQLTVRTNVFEGDKRLALLADVVSGLICRFLNLSREIKASFF